MDKESEGRQMTNRWICIDSQECVEFGDTPEEALNNYLSTIDSYADVDKLLFFCLDNPLKMERKVTMVKI